MERAIPHSADHSPVEKRPIAQGLEELRTVLGDLARLALTSGSDVMKLTREDFQSQTYQQAGYGAMPERYGTADRYIYTLEYADGTQLIIFGGKFAPARRFAGDPASDPLADHRESSHFIYKYIYKYNGKNMTTERLPNGKVNRLTRRYGKPGEPRNAGRIGVGHVLYGAKFNHEFSPPTEDRPTWDSGPKAA